MSRMGRKIHDNRRKCSIKTTKSMSIRRHRLALCRGSVKLIPEARAVLVLHPNLPQAHLGEQTRQKCRANRTETRCWPRGRYLTKQAVPVVKEGVLSAILPVQELLGEVVELAQTAENAGTRARAISIVQKVPELVHIFRGFVWVENRSCKQLSRICVERVE